METKPKCCGIIVAAGGSTRMALGVCKQFILLNGVPAIVRTLNAFEEADRIDSVVIVCREEDMPQFNKCFEQYHFTKVRNLVNGGSTRQQSVAAGVRSAPDDTRYFVIHDGARAMITPDEINAVAEDGILYSASSLAVPVKDTIKIVNEQGFVVSTPKRSELWAVQTPQVFEKKLYLKALEQAEMTGSDYTDDCQLVEQLGIRVHICLGEYTNLKLTTADDIALSETIIKQRESRQ